MDFYNPFDLAGEWLKGNLHTHTTNSDGVICPQERARAYEERGYDFLALTDHGRVTEIDDVTTRRLILIRSTEAHAPMPTGGGQSHIVGLDLPKGFELPEARHTQTLIDALNDAGGKVVVAHPYWCGHSVKDLEVLHDYIGLEVFNTTCLRGIGKGTSSVHWDDLLAQRRRLFGFAVDDAHAETRDAYQGWIMVKAAERTREAVMDAIACGCFYATCGPAIESIEVDGGVVRVRTSPVAYISFVSDGPRGGHRFNQDGSPVTEAEYELSGSRLYVRIEATDHAGRTAWSNPIFLFD